MTSLRDMLMTLKMKDAIVDESVRLFLKLTAIQIRGKIHTTWPRCCPCDLEGHFMVYFQMVMTTEKATKLWHDHVTYLEACFVIVLLQFNNLLAVFFI